MHTYTHTCACMHAFSWKHAWFRTRGGICGTIS